MRPCDPGWTKRASVAICPIQSTGACTEIIAQGRETSLRLALAYSNRCAAYDEAADAEENFIDKALADRDKAIELDPKLAAAYNKRCSVRTQKKDYDRALASAKARHRHGFRGATV